MSEFIEVKVRWHRFFSGNAPLGDKRNFSWSSSGSAASSSLRIIIKTRCSRANEKHKRFAKTQLAAASRVGCAGGLADSLHSLELNLARHQSWPARFAADFIRSYSFSYRHLRVVGRFGRSYAIAPTTPQRLCGFGNHRCSHVCRELHVAILGGVTRVIGSRCCPASYHPDVRFDLRALDAAG